MELSANAQIAIMCFRDATRTLKAAKMALDEQIEPLLEKATLEDLQYLVDSLPPDYPSVRRIHQMILERE